MYIFNPTLFRELYPEFSELTDAQLNNFYQGSINYTRPFITGNDDQDGYLINQTVAHLIAMSSISGGSALGGRLSSATENSITASVEYNPSKAGFWWNSTSYGSEIWNRMLQRGGARYFAGVPVRYVNRRYRRCW